MVLSSNRKLRVVTIDGLMWTSGSAGLDVFTLEIFEKHGKHIRELALSNSPLISATMWCQLLTTMPQLEKLKMNGVTVLVIKEDSWNIAEKPILKKLKTIELFDSRCNLLTRIECTLKSLKISISTHYHTFPQESSFYEQFSLNTSVTSLNIRNLHWNANDLALKDFLNRFPNIEELTYDWFRRSIVAYIAETMTKLKEVTVGLFNSPEFDGLKFHALESLHIEALGGSINWATFTKDNPGIKELSFGRLYWPEYLDLQAITKNLKELRKLTIESSDLNCDEKFFEMIRKNCHELKFLNLNANSLKVDIASVADIPGLRFQDY